MMALNIKELLTLTALEDSDRGIKVYPLGNTTECTTVKYSELHRLAQRNGQALKRSGGFGNGSIVLLHFDNHLDNIIWFWSAVYADCVPAMSTPFAQNPEHRDKHLQHLHKLLRDPVCLTTKELVDKFPKTPILRLLTTEALLSIPKSDFERTKSPSSWESGDLAMLMLTSGSTGNAKAVCLTNEQVLGSLGGKSIALSPNRPSLDESSLDGSFHDACSLYEEDKHAFLNWIGLDHVGSLIEIHLLATALGMDQIHVQSPDMIADPILFLQMIARYSVASTFAPNFFLAMLKTAMEERSPDSERYDLGCLHHIVSGGEANVVTLCKDLSQLLVQHGAPKNSIVPGFGMTETCAGSIYSLACPQYDIEHSHEFASLGDCIEGIQMRTSSMTNVGSQAQPGEPGNLEINGQIVFKRYYNNKIATAEAFTPDGWFKTGDVAIIDQQGKLNLAGRTKDVISINGVKYLPQEIETAIEEVAIPGMVPSYTVCFHHRPPNSQTEQCCVVYLPSYSAADTKARAQTLAAIVKVVVLHAGARPYVLPLDRLALEKSTLGKLSRTKIRLALERGDLGAYDESNNIALTLFKSIHRVPPTNDTEHALLEEVGAVLVIDRDEIGVESSIFDFGVTSVELIRYKRRIEERLHLATEIPMITMMTNPTIRTLATVLQSKNSTGVTAYDPVVTLQPHGEKCALWLIHPGVGEILVFFGLARYVGDRPVYALRARGFNPGELYFQDIAETVATYHTAIKKKQPIGPYAIAGYSYGSMLAFEISKKLIASGDDVAFLGSFNLPPHIKFRMRQLDWTECLLHLAFFLDLISEQYSREVSDTLHRCSKQDALAHVMQVASPERLTELYLSTEKLANWADLAFALQNMARDYDPCGKVTGMDVFYCEPLAIVAQNKAEWRAKHLDKWSEFCETEPRFHEVNGSHYTMIGPDHVQTFQKTLKKALQARGV